ncbi:hypothetical protein Hanom_Chr11g01045231 [Helianthus anomalus]
MDIVYTIKLDTSRLVAPDDLKLIKLRVLAQNELICSIAFQILSTTRGIIKLIKTKTQNYLQGEKS